LGVFKVAEIFHVFVATVKLEHMGVDCVLHALYVLCMRVNDVFCQFDTLFCDEDITRPVRRVVFLELLYICQRVQDIESVPFSITVFNGSLLFHPI
jgi:hypothetical protein